MSVQAGIWNYDGAPVSEGCLSRFSRQLEELAPDAEKTRVSGPLGMLYRPFHTTPESRREQQPHEHPSGRILTWDGRLDNRAELTSLLELDSGAPYTDVELVGAAFDRWELDSFAKLVGEWALVLWNPNSRELILARDYIGIRRLFYYPKLNGIMWCTRLEPLALCGDQFTLNDEYFSGYLALWPDAALTPYRQLLSVPPGNFVCVRGTQFRLTNYWTFDPRREIRYKRDKEYEEHYRHLFRQAVRRRLRANGPVLAELSGGLDSSSIVCMADEILQQEGAEATSLDTFSSCDRDEPEEEDFRYFSLVEAKRGRIGKHVELGSLHNSSTRGYFQFTRFAGMPGFHGHPRLSEAKHNLIVANGYRVVLSGVGGDETSGQALDPRVQLADLLRRGRLKFLAEELIAWSLLLRRPALHLVLDALSLQLPGWIRTRIVDEGKIAPWVNKRFSRKNRLSSWQSGTIDGSWKWLPSRRDWFHTVRTLSRQMTKLPTHAWETRYPCLDQSLVEFLMAIPIEQLLRPGDRRSLMRRAFADLLPEEIRTRRTKATSARFHSVALEEHWDVLAPILRSPVLSRLGYVNQQPFYESIMDAKKGNLGSHFLRLNKALAWELWLRDAISRGVVNTDIAHSPRGIGSIGPNAILGTMSSG